MDDIDIYRAAKLLIDHHGTKAPAEAARLAAEQIAVGDVQGHATWRRVAAAVEELLDASRPTGATLQ